MAYTGEQPKTGQIAGLVSSVYKELGKGTASSNQAITSTTAPGTDITGLSVTATPDGTHDVKVSWSIPAFNVTLAVSTFVALQKDGAVVSTWRFPSASASTESATLGGVYVDVTPAASSHTWKLSAWVSSAATLNTVDQVNTPTVQNVIVVEQIG